MLRQTVYSWILGRVGDQYHAGFGQKREGRREKRMVKRVWRRLSPPIYGLNAATAAAVGSSI